MKNRKPAMAAPRTPTRKKEKSVESEYLGYFVPAPSPLWRSDDENYSLEQPSHLKWVPSETTYGIGHLVLSIPVDA